MKTELSLIKNKFNEDDWNRFNDLFDEVVEKNFDEAQISALFAKVLKYMNTPVAVHEDLLVETAKEFIRINDLPDDAVTIAVYAQIFDDWVDHDMINESTGMKHVYGAHNIEFWVKC